MKLKQLKTEPFLYYRRDKNDTVIMCIIVDDVIVLCKNEEKKNSILKALREEIRHEGFDEVQNFLGMRITRDKTKGALYIDQEEYNKEILKKFRMDGSRPTATPMDHRFGLSEDKSEYAVGTPYMEAVGSLLYVSQILRSAIAQAVNTGADLINHLLGFIGVL